MKLARVDLAHRRSRVQSADAKRPTITIEVTRRPCPVAKEQFIDLLLELLDEQRRSPVADLDNKTTPGEGANDER